MTLEEFHPFSSLATDLGLAESGSTDGAHDLTHVLRVWRNAQAIHRQEGGDLEILAASVLLHDCITIPKNSPLRAQASILAAAEATKRLMALGWPHARIEWVAEAIRSHSYSAQISPTTLEARILQDADRLDALGFTGIARCFYTAGRLGSFLYHPTDPAARNRPLDDATYALDHFPAKLLKLTEGFQTTTGQTLATERYQAVQSFYQGMLRELATPPL